jgi:hypothetical protein
LGTVWPVLYSRAKWKYEYFFKSTVLFGATCGSQREAELMRSLIIALLLAVGSSAQVFPYLCYVGYLAFPAWHKAEQGKPSLYFGIQREVELKTRMIQYDPQTKQFIYDAEWVAVNGTN